MALPFGDEESCQLTLGAATQRARHRALERKRISIIFNLRYAFARSGHKPPQNQTGFSSPKPLSFLGFAFFMCHSSLDDTKMQNRVRAKPHPMAIGQRGHLYLGEDKPAILILESLMPG